MSERSMSRQGMNQQSNGGGVPFVPNPLPHAGQQQDLNYVYGLLGELSEVLRHNREQTEHIVDGVRRIQSRVQETGAQPTLQEVNAELNRGETNHESRENNAARIADLEAQVAIMARDLFTAHKDVLDYVEINDTYQEAMNTMMIKIRKYVYEKELELIALRRTHNDQIQQLRDDNLEMRLEHSRWQEGLGRAMHWARQALRAASDEEEPFLIERAELRHENRFLRRMVGWEVPDDEDEKDNDNETGNDEVGHTNNINEGMTQDQ